MLAAPLRAAVGRVRRLAAHALWLTASILPAAHADAPPPVGFPSTGGFTATLKSTRNHVAVIELTGDYSRNLSGGELNVEPRTQIAKEFYKNFADAYDFIVVFSDFEFSTGDAKAFYIGVKNDTKGLGSPLYDNTARFGSAGALQGYIDMAALGRYHLDPSDARFEEVMRVLSHELLHRWAATVSFINADGNRNGSLLGRDGSHWSFLLDTGGSVEYGNRWADNGNGTFSSKPDRQFFSPLDLYLMGMLKKEEVPPFFYIESPGADAHRLPEAGVTISGTRRDVTIDQVIAAEGAREPAADAAQKQFRFGFVLLTRPGTAPSDLAVQRVNAVRLAFETRLAALTGGKALAHAFLEPKRLGPQVDTSLPSPVVRAPGATADVTAALSWLRNRQEAEGAWHDNPLTRLRDTVVATAALGDVGANGQTQVDKAMTWLAAQAVSNTDYIARRVLALGTRATEADWMQLAASQNADGGWGVAPGYQSTPLDTSLAVTAAALDPNTSRKALARERAKAFLLAKQNADGGWSHAVSGVSRTATTAQVMQALAGLDAPAAVASAARFLAGRQNSDGGFGDSPSTTHDTSNVILALATAGQLGAIRAVDGFDFLNATQQTDGSWDGSVYATGLAVRTLGATRTYNWSAGMLEAAPSGVRDGQRVSLSMVVTNTGTVAAPATTLKLFLGEPAGGPTLLELPVPPLPPGQSTLVRGSWSTFDQPGNHLLTAVIDPAAAGAEVTRNDNTATVRVAVAPAPVQADLAVTAGDLLVVPTVINRLPTDVSVVAQLANIGQTDALGVKVRLLTGPSTANLRVVDEKVVNLLGRSTVPVTTSFQVMQPGRQLLVVLVDADSAVSDVDRSNNRAEAEIDTVSSYDPAVLDADLVVPAPSAVRGADVTLKATLRNYGTVDTPPFQAVLTVSDGASMREIGRLSVQLGAGSTKTFSLPWRVDLVGPLDFKVALDPAATVSDLDRSNNEAHAAFTAAEPSAGPNLAVGFREFLVEPDPAQEGRPLVLKALIRNTGNQPAANIEFGFYEGDPAQGGVLLAPLQTIASLAAGASVDVSAELPSITGTSDRLLFVGVDPAGRITESSREDNSAFRVVEVRALPDLAVSAGNIKVSPAAPRPGDALTVTVDVPNLGQQQSGPVVVRLLDGDAAGTLLGQQTLASIGPQDKGTATFAVPASSQSAARSLTVVVDPDNGVAEGNESNNSATRGLTVQSGTAFVTEPYFSPNGDSIKDEVAFGFRVDAPSVTRVLVVDERDQVVRTFTGLGAGPQHEGSVVWDGRGDNLRMVGDSTYRFRAVGSDGATLSEAATIVDTNRTPILRASGTPAEYYRNLTCRVAGIQEWTTTQDEQSLFVSVPRINDPGREGIFRIALQGGEVTTVIPGSFVEEGAAGAMSHLSASARSDRLVFSRWKYSYPNGQFQSANEIWTVGGDGTGRRMLATNATGQVPPADRYDWVEELMLSHDGSFVVAHVRTNDGSAMLRRLPVDTGSTPVQLLFDGRSNDFNSISEMKVAPNRRRAFIRLWSSTLRKNTLAVIDFETGAIFNVPAGLYPDRFFQNEHRIKWSPDSTRFVLYNTVHEMGIEDENRIDFEFDVFDADFQLSKRFRTDKGPGDDSWYSGEISGPEWSSSGDEFVFSLDPRPWGWYGELTAADFSATATPIDDPAQKTFYRAHVTAGTLTQVPVDPERIARNGTLWWPSNDRTTVSDGEGDTGDGWRYYHHSIHVDSGQSGALFPKWWATEQNPQQQYMSVADFSPSGRRLFFTSYRDTYNNQSACYSPSGYHQLFAYESLHNLVADLQPLRDPRVGGVVLKGTASDINFSGYTLDYASTRTPNEWHAVTVPGSEQKFGEKLATWVPPAFGTFFVRLSVFDRAGNTAQAVRRVTWNDTPAITDLVKNFDYISPNGDGQQDTLVLSYRVLEPVHLAFEVRREDGTRVRLVERDHASIGADFNFEWDGRDDDGRFAPDGKYTVRVLDYEFGFEIDTVAPQLALATSLHAFDFRLGAPASLTYTSPIDGQETDRISFDSVDTFSHSVSVRDALGQKWLTRNLGSGSVSFSWDGKADDGRDMPPGTYVTDLLDRDGKGVARFATEVRRSAGQANVGFRPMLPPSAKIDEAPFSLAAKDRLLDNASVLLDYGWGDPPAEWVAGFKDMVVQPPRAGVAIDPGQFGDDPDTRLPTAKVHGVSDPWHFAGLRIRATAKDRAGNAAVDLGPYRGDSEFVLADGLAYYWNAAAPAKTKVHCLVPATNFSTASLEVGTARIVAPGSPCPDAVNAADQLRSLRVSFVDSLAQPAPRVELRYAFLPRPVLQRDAPPEPFAVPAEEDLRRLQWTSVPLRGANPTEVATGINDLITNDHEYRFEWRLPHDRSGVWLWQMVARNADSSELRSNVHWTTVVKPVPPITFPWQAYHEPALTCGAPVTEIAHVQVAVSTYDEKLFPYVVNGQRLHHVRADASLELIAETALSNEGVGFVFEPTFSTASWALGRHNFVVEMLVNGTWMLVSQPYVFVNHQPPQVRITSPLEGQKMCASRVTIDDKGTIGYLPMSVEVTEPYAAYEDLQLSKPDDRWVHRGPVAHGTDLFGAAATSREGKALICRLLPEACGDSGPLVWPSRGGHFVHALSGKLWGLGQGSPESIERDPFDGQVTARLRAYGPSGHLACTPVTVDVDGRVEASSSIDLRLFSPNGDGVLDDILVTLSALESITVKVEVLRAVRDPLTGKVTVVPSPIVATLLSNLSMNDGDRLVPWDGRDSGGQVAADGTYVFRITMTDGCGNEKVDSWDFDLDNTPPTIGVDSPKPNAAVPIEFVVKGSIGDVHPLRYEVAAVTDSSPDAPIGLPAIGGMNQPHVDLARWNTAGITGGARLVLRAHDRAGNSSTLEVPIQLTEPVEIITAFNPAPDPFSPNGDGRREKVSLLYTLSRSAHLSLDLFRVSTNTRIKTLMTRVAATAGNGAVQWDGRNEGQQVEPDEDVAAVLTAEVLVDGEPTARQVARTGFTLDKTPPVITFSLPKGPVTAGRGGVVARAVDPLFAVASVGVSSNGGPFVTLAEAQDESGTMTGSLDDIPEGPIRLRADASDRAENQSTQTLAVVLDRTPPQVAINAPLANAYVSGLKQPTPIEGSVVELHLARYRLLLGQGAPPAPQSVLAESTVLPARPTLLSWNPLAVADGPYTLSLSADDQAELTGTVSVPITVDNTPPVAAVEATGSPMYLRAGTVVKGTATDLNYQGHRIEIAPGRAGSASQWTEIARGTAAVAAGGSLATLQVLPADGVYTLRLTVIDKAGNESASLQEVTVDTTAPGQVLNLTAEVKNRRDGHVKWNAASEADVAGYVLLRNGSRVNATLLATTSYVDPGLAAGTYTYTVKTVDRAGNESEPSNEGRIVVTLSEPVAQIFAPLRESFAAGLVDVRGTATAPADFKEYRLYIGVGRTPATWHLLRRSPLGLTADSLAAWNTLSLAEGSTYTLKLEAEDLSGQVATDSVTVQVKNTPPRAPIQLQAVPNASNVALTWTANTEPDLQGYLLHRDQRLANASGLVIGSLVPYLIKPASYNDLGVADGIHRYFVQAMDVAGNVSEPSNAVEVKIDTRPPHVAIVKPADGSKVSQTATLIGESPDTDIVRVQFQYKLASDTAWIDMGPPLTAAPWTVEWSTAALPHGSYHVRAVATDDGNKTDPNPGFVALVVTDLRKPDPAVSLRARVNAGDVTLDWAASASTYAVGYHIDRVEPNGTVSRLTATPLPALTHVDAGLADAAYVYRVYAASVGGTESEPSNDAPAVVFTPGFEQPYTPTPDTMAALIGQTRPQHRVILQTAAGDPVIEGTSDENGRYELALPLAMGDNRFVLLARDDSGNISKSVALHAFRGIAPAAPVGLNAAVVDHTVQLTWSANSEPDLAGYVPALERQPHVSPIVLSGATASSTYPNGSFYAPSRAIDGDPNSGWMPSWNAPAAGQWLEAAMSGPRVIDSVSLRWASSWQMPSAYRIEGYDGEVWVPLAKAVTTSFDPVVDIKLARPYRTARLRVLIVESNGGLPQLNDIRLTGLDVGNGLAASFANLPDGHPKVGVLAVSRLGFTSPMSEATPPVGDVTSPQAPVLQAQPAGSDAALAWTGPDDADVAGFRITRDGVLIATLDDGTARSHVDPALANARYVYTVTAFDAIGNAGPGSNEAPVVIDVAGPNAPITATASAPAQGGSVIVQWSVGSGPQPASFVLHRAEQPAGPYAVLRTGLTETIHDDREVANGVRYYYVVKGVDALGNAGSTSNEANAMPLDRAAPATPFFVLPGRSPGPVITAEGKATLVGIAEPGSRVVVTRDEQALGTVDALAGDEVRYVEGSGNDSFDVSADGRFMFFGSNEAPVVRYDGQVVAANALAGRRIHEFRFARDGRSAVVVHNTNFGDLLLGLWDVATDTLVTLAPNVDSGLLSMSPNGSHVAVRAYDQDAGEWGLRIVDLATRSSQFMPGSFGGAAWSPDGQTLALAQDGTLRLTDATFARNDVVAGVDDANNPSWLPGGSGLLVEHRGASGRIEIVRVSMPSLTVAPVGAVADADLWMPVASPDGDAYLAFRDSALVKRSFGGAETVLEDYVPNWVRGPIWAASHTIAYYDDSGRLALRAPAGQFMLPDTPLAVGANHFGAYASDATGNTSAPAPSLEVRRLGDGLPDWAVSNDSWIVFPATPQVGQATDIHLTIANIGAVAPAAPVSVIIADDHGTITRLSAGSLAPLAAGGRQTLRMSWVPPQAGHYVLMAVVDPAGLTEEASKDNNQAARELHVNVAGALPELHVTTSQPRYAGGQTVQAEVAAATAGAQFDGSLAVRVVDAGGAEVMRFDARPVQALRFGQTQKFAYSWPSGSTFAGDYRVLAELLAPDAAQPVAQGGALFALDAGAELATTVTTDRASYLTGDNVAARGTLRYVGGNLLSLTAPAVLSIVSSAGDVLASRTLDVQGLLAGSEVQIDMTWPAGQPGPYTAGLRVGPAEAPLSSASAGFSVGAPTLPAVAGRLQVANDVFETTEAIPTTASLTNRGAAIEPLPVRVRAVDSTGAQTFATWTADLANVGSEPVSAPALLNGTWPLGSFEIRLEAQLAGQWTQLDRVRVQAAERTPPAVTFTGPAPGAVVRSSAIVTTLATVRQAAVAKVEMSFNPLSWLAMQLQSAQIGEYFSNALPATDGPVTLQARATDVQGLASATASLSIVIDNTPPLIVVSGVTEGQFARNAVTPAISVTDLHLVAHSIALNGAPFVAGTPVGEGTHQLVVDASDRADNRSTASVGFTVDLTPPAIAISGVAQGGRYTHSATPVIVVTELHPATQETTLDGVLFTSGTAVTTSGSHTLVVRATDRAGNESQQSVTFEIEQPVELNGSLGASPATVPIGETVTLDARVSNASASAANGVQISLTLRDRASGAVLQTFTDTADLPPGGAYQRAWSWAASGTAGALVDAVLTATAGTTTPIAQDTIQLAAPNARIDLQSTLAGPKKLLVYVRCTRMEDDTWDNCAAPNRVFSNASTVSACTSDRITWLAQYLTAQGIAHTIVADEAAFVRELRSGRYGTYWLGGGALKMGTSAAAEVQAAVRRGDTLLVEGWTPGRNPVLDTVASVSFLGKWSTLTGMITTTGSVLPAATLSVNTPVRLASTTGTRHATLNSGHGIVSGTYGLGRTIAFAFDLAGSLRNPSSTTSWNGVIQASLQHLERTVVADPVGGGVVKLKASVTNSGSDTPSLDVLAKLPAAAQVLETAPAATASTVEGGLPTLRWRVAPAAGATLSFETTLRAPITEGEYIVSGLVDQVRDGSSLLQSQQLTLRVLGPVSLTDAALNKVQALVLSGNDANAQASTAGWLTLARMSVADERWLDALRHLIAAQTALQAVAGAQAEEGKLAIARAIEAVERRL